MAKTWTDVSVGLGRLICSVDGDLFDSAGSSTITLSNRYKFVDDVNNVVNGVFNDDTVTINDFTIVDTAANYPTDVLAALQTLDTYLHDEAVIQSGL